MTAREDVPHFGPKLPNPAIFKKVCHFDVARFFSSNSFCKPPRFHLPSGLVFSFHTFIIPPAIVLILPLLKSDVEIPLMMNIFVHL